MEILVQLVELLKIQVLKTTLNLKENITINKGSTDSYILYIWLSNDPDNNQTQLLNGSFSGKVGFRGVTK